MCIKQLRNYLAEIQLGVCCCLQTLFPSSRVYFKIPILYFVICPAMKGVACFDVNWTVKLEIDTAVSSYFVVEMDL